MDLIQNSEQIGFDKTITKTVNKPIYTISSSDSYYDDENDGDDKYVYDN